MGFSLLKKEKEINLGYEVITKDENYYTKDPSNNLIELKI